MRAHRQAGQSLIESCLVIALTCVIFFGLFQVSQLFAAREILDYAAGRGLRAKTVGFNRFMVFKTILVGAIPNAGHMTVPPPVGGPAAQHALERPRIPLYLGSESQGYLSSILQYERWPTITFTDPLVIYDGMLHIDVKQEYPLDVAFHSTFYAADSVELKSDSYLDDHYPLYLTDEGF